MHAPPLQPLNGGYRGVRPFSDPAFFALLGHWIRSPEPSDLWMSVSQVFREIRSPSDPYRTSFHLDACDILRPLEWHEGSLGSPCHIDLARVLTPLGRTQMDRLLTAPWKELELPALEEWRWPARASYLAWADAGVLESLLAKYDLGLTPTDLWEVMGCVRRSETARCLTERGHELLCHICREQPIQVLRLLLGGDPSRLAGPLEELSELFEERNWAAILSLLPMEEGRAFAHVLRLLDNWPPHEPHAPVEGRYESSIQTIDPELARRVLPRAPLGCEPRISCLRIG